MPRRFFSWLFSKLRKGNKREEANSREAERAVGQEERTTTARRVNNIRIFSQEEQQRINSAASKLRKIIRDTIAEKANCDPSEISEYRQKNSHAVPLTRDAFEECIAFFYDYFGRERKSKVHEAFGILMQDMHGVLYYVLFRLAEDGRSLHIRIRAPSEQRGRTIHYKEIYSGAIQVSELI